MYRRLTGASLTAALLAASWPAAAQPAPEPEPSPLSAPEFDPNAPLPDIPEIEDDWQALQQPETGEAPTETVATGELRYRFPTANIESFPFSAQFKGLSALYAGRNDPVDSVAELQRRVREDSDLLRRLFRAEGFYDPDITIEVDPELRNGTLDIITAIDPGPRYRIGEIDINIDDPSQRGTVESALGLAVDDPLNAMRLNTAVDRLRLRLTEQGFPFAKVEDPDILVDHDTRTAAYTLNVDLGSASRFGSIEVAGDRLFSAKHLTRLARFKPGDQYSSADVEDLRRAIIATGLVSSVSIVPRERPGTAPGEPATVDLVVTLTPAPPRTIAGQIGYSTTDGFRAEASWQHRNLIRPQGQVTIRGVAGTEEQRFGAELRRSNWKMRDRTLGARLELSREDRAAFFARSLNAEAFIERETNLIWQKAWTYRFGAELLTSQERDRSLRIAPGFAPLRTFIVAAAPLQLSYDGSDDLLDPKRGFRLAGRASPELSFQNSFFGYLKAQIEGSGYLPMMDDKLVLAGRARFGTIFGAERSRIAPSRRFYAGGGGSVRGYGFQDVGPRDIDNDPLGGRSIVEFSAEARYRFGNFGIVPFIDAGQVDTRFYPRFKDLQFGAGIGARYYTNFGPIRFDVATPLNRQKGDPRVAIYVSIGQAF